MLRFPFAIPFVIDIQIANLLSSLATQATFSSNNLNIFIRQPDGSYLGDSLDSPKGDQDEKLYGSWHASGVTDSNKTFVVEYVLDSCIVSALI